jgi:hypothetical protein
MVILDGDVLGSRPQLWASRELNRPHIVLKNLASDSGNFHGNGHSVRYKFIQQAHDVNDVTRAVDNAMYSASVVESATVVCSLELQIKGHPANQMM